MRDWFSGKMTAFQAVDGSSILPSRTSEEKPSSPRPLRRARRPNCKEFWLKKSIGGFELVKEIFFIKVEIIS
jgi:hypothetical protein